MDSKANNPLRDKEEEGRKWKRETRKLIFFLLLSLLIKMTMDYGTNKGLSGRQKEMHRFGNKRDMPLTVSSTTYTGKSFILSKSLFPHLYNGV